MSGRAWLEDRDLAKEPTPREIRSAATRKRIYDTAIALFTSRGYDNVTVIDICRAAGVAVGTFYHFFGSKDGTLLQGLTAEDAAVDDLLARSQGESPEERIRRLFLNRVAMGTVRITLDLSVAFTVAELKHGLPDAFNSPRRVYDALRDEVTAAQLAGTLATDLDPDTVTEGLLFTAAGLIQAWQLAAGEFPVMSKAEQHIDTLLKAMNR